MDRKFNYSAVNESDKNNEMGKKLRERFYWRDNEVKNRKDAFEYLSSDHQHLIEYYLKLQHGLHLNGIDDLVVNEIRNGIISLAYEGMRKFPRRLVESLRNDITHLDLTANKIRSFEFLSAFKNLKSLVVDENINMDMESFPQIGRLELFYANKCNIEFPRSFILRVSVVFPSLKYLSMMSNPAINRSGLQTVQEERERRRRMFAIFMNPKLIHFNDKKISEDEREYSKSHHKCLGPTDCHLSRLENLPGTNELKKILPLFNVNKHRRVISLDIQENADILYERLNCIAISK